MLAAIVSLALSAAGAALTRGPYLHGGSSSNMIVRWRTDAAEVGRVRLGITTNLGLFADEAAATTNHIVVLTNLAPDSGYFYSGGRGGGSLAGGTAYFF